MFCYYGNDAYYVLDRGNGEIIETVGIDFENKASRKDKNDVSLINSFTHLGSVPIVCGDYLFVTSRQKMPVAVIAFMAQTQKVLSPIRKMEAGTVCWNQFAAMPILS